MCKFAFGSTVAIFLALEATSVISESMKIIDIPSDIDKIELKPMERIYFNRFKAEVGTNFTKEFMSKDVYLIKWLRATRFNIPEAVEKIRFMLEWRKEVGMDNILEEDFTDFIRLFPFTMDSVDFFGRPVGTASIDDWDVRKVILAGNREKAIRFVYYVAELGVMKVVEANSKYPNVSSGILLGNLAGFNKQQHACSECIPVFRNLVASLEKYFPFMLHKLIAINTPQTFYSVFRLFVPMMGKYTKSIIKIYGTDRRQWQPVILSMMEANQITPEFGGTRIM